MNNIVISDLRDALVNFGVKNKMLAKGDSLAIKLNDSNVLIISNNKCDFLYKVQIYQTGNTLEENIISIPSSFKLKGLPSQYKDNSQGIGSKDGVMSYYYLDEHYEWQAFYEPQDLLELIPGVIEDIVEVINFYNGD